MRDPTIHGILVQMPLPQHIAAAARSSRRSPRARMSTAFRSLSAGALVAGLPGFRPCTPYGCMKLIESTGVALRGRHAVVIGRSNTVGKPMALLLLQANATVTICHSATADLGRHTRQADVVVAAVGRRNTLDRATWSNRDAVVIDVGMNRNDDRQAAAATSTSARVVAGRRADHAGPGRRRSDDDRDAAGQHRLEAAGAGRRDHTYPIPTMNPLLDFSSCRAFARDPARAHRAGDRRARWRRPKRHWRARPAMRVPADYGGAVGGARRRDRAAVARLGNRRPPERRRRHAGAARGLYREAGEDGRVPPPGSAPIRFCSRSTGRCSRTAPQALTTSRKKALSNALRDFVLSGAELEGEAETRFAQVQDRLGRLRLEVLEHVLDATDGFAYCARRKPSSPASRPTSRPRYALLRSTPAATATRSALHAPSYNLAGDAARREPCVARTGLHRTAW